MSFKFGPSEKKLNIEGLEFVIKVGDIETIERFNEGLAKAPEPVENDPTGLRANVSHIKVLLDVILGPGAYEKVFEGRPLNIKEHIELINYLTQELNKLNSERDKALLGDTPPPVVVNTTVLDAIKREDDTVQ
jgi:hypothetical protein